MLDVALVVSYFILTTALPSVVLCSNSSALWTALPLVDCRRFFCLCLVFLVMTPQVVAHADAHYRVVAAPAGADCDGGCSSFSCLASGESICCSQLLQSFAVVGVSAKNKNNNSSTLHWTVCECSCKHRCDRRRYEGRFISHDKTPGVSGGAWWCNGGGVLQQPQPRPRSQPRTSSAARERRTGRNCGGFGG